MKNLILAALVGAALSAGALLGKAKLDDAALNKASIAASHEEPACLRNEDASEVLVILESDEEGRAYRGVRVLIGMIQLPFEATARSVNTRTDLKKVDCRTGQ